MLIIIVLLFYGIWLWNINKETKKLRELDKKYTNLNKRVVELDKIVFGFDTTQNREEDIPIFEEVVNGE